MKIWAVALLAHGGGDKEQAKRIGLTKFAALVEDKTEDTRFAASAIEMKPDELQSFLTLATAINTMEVQ